MSTDAAALTELIERALTAFEAGDFAAAEAVCVTVLKAVPDHFDAIHLLAVLQRRLGRREDALKSYGRMLAIRPEYAEGHSDRGVVLQELGRFGDALASYDKALAFDPDNAEVHTNRGVVLQKLKRVDEAIASYDKALALRPDYAEAHYIRGAALSELRCFAPALASLEQAVALEPEYPDALCCRGIALCELHRFSEALASFDQALAVRPDYPEALGGRGNALHRLNQFDEALASFDRALALDPALGAAHRNRGLVLEDLRRFAEALASFEKAQALAPDHAEAHWNEAELRLLTGDFSRGWSKFAWRARRDGATARRRFDRPQWDGLGSLYDRTILLHGDEHLSDTIQFCRYVPQVAARGARVILEVAHPLRGLMADLAGADAIISTGEEPPAFDLHCPLANLPMAFGTKLETIPSGTPYLRVPTESLMAAEMRLAGVEKPRIGLAWADGPKHLDDLRRSLAPRALLPLFDGGATFVHLQTDPRPAGDAVIDPGDTLNDLSETAALISRLDLVIAVDTSVAHLAGALARPVWILLPYTPDWCWLLGRNTTAWYPTARLYRQAKPGDWAEVIARVKIDLRVFAGEKSPVEPTRKPV
jgi:tetratricopeptide (TPR) repeat protein